MSTDVLYKMLKLIVWFLNYLATLQIIRTAGQTPQYVL